MSRPTLAALCLFAAAAQLSPMPAQQDPEETKEPDHFIKQINVGTGFVLEGGGWYADGYSSTKKGEE